ncbi:MAG: CBS domain-containing protein [Pseudomonadota bacterium]|nr:CBS domain-containing protein [Pseudomonadota bacterium]
MTAKTIMSSDLVTVTSDVTVAEALLKMSKYQVHNIPVVDETDSFVGLFSLRRLAHELLPTAARLEAESFQMDIAFLSDQSDEFLQRLQEIGRKPVSELLEKKKKLRFCGPDTPIPRLLQLLSENPTSLPVVVVQGKRQKVVGMVSTWDVLTKIAVNLLPGVSGDEQGARED